MTTELARTEPNTLAALAPQRSQFDDLARHAAALAKSDIIPKSYQGNPSNCLIAIELASRLGSSPMLVMQSLHIIQGRPSWSSQFLIASVNSCGKFSPIRYRFDGKPGSQEFGCTAIATELATGEILEGPMVTMAMVKAEGWLSKSGSKWQTMPDLMFRYRAAAFWARVYCPEVSMGLHTQEEREDIEPVQVARFSLSTRQIGEQAPALALPEVATQAEPKSEPKSEPVRMREPGEEG